MTDGGDGLTRAVREFERLTQYTPTEKEFFDCDDLVQTRVSRQARKAAEAVAPLVEGLREAHPAVPWDAVAAWRGLPQHPDGDAARDAVWAAAGMAPAVLSALTARPGEDGA